MIAKTRRRQNDRPNDQSSDRSRRPKNRQSKRSTDLETNVVPDALQDDPGRDDPPDSLPPRDVGIGERMPTGGGFTPAEDGGVEQHPIHDEDREDADASDYEREIDRLDAAVRRRD